MSDRFSATVATGGRVVFASSAAADDERADLPPAPKRWLSPPLLTSPIVRPSSTQSDPAVQAWHTDKQQRLQQTPASSSGPASPFAVSGRVGPDGRPRGNSQSWSLHTHRSASHSTQTAPSKAVVSPSATHSIFSSDSPVSLPPTTMSPPLHSPFFPLVQRPTTGAAPPLPPAEILARPSQPSPGAAPYPRRPNLRRARPSSDIALSMPPTPAESTTRLVSHSTPMTPGVPASDAVVAPHRKPIPWPGPDDRPYPWRHWTAVLFAINVAGVYAAGLGAIWLERGIYATQPLMPPDAPRPPGLGPDMPRPDLLNDFRSPQAAIAAGAIATAIGLAASLWATWRCCLDGRALASRGLGTHPRALWRPNIYGSINAVNQFLWWAYRFRAEATRDHADIHDAWLNGAMGAVGAAAFAAIQSIALSSSEALRGELWPAWRLTASRVAMATVGISYPLFAHFVAQPGSSAEVRMTLRVVASAALTVANTIILTHMRKLTPMQVRSADSGVFAQDAALAAAPKRLGFIPQQFYPLALLATHGMGRLLIHIFSVPWAVIYRKGHPSLHAGTYGPPPEDNHTGSVATDDLRVPAFNGTQNQPSLAGPMPGDRVDADERTGIALVALGVALGFAVAGLYGYDASKVRRRDWGVLCAACLLSTTLVGVHRVLNESQRNMYRAQYEGASLTLGSVGYATEFVSLVTLFAYSQMRNGRPSWPWTDHVLQLVRATGETALHMWALMAGFKTSNPIIMAATFTAGSFLTQLGLAIPTGVVGHAQTKSSLEHEQAIALFDHGPQAPLHVLEQNDGEPLDSTAPSNPGRRVSVHPE